MIAKKFRLPLRTNLVDTKKHGTSKTFSHFNIVVNLKKGPTRIDNPRFGVVLGKRVSKKAVKRNKIKRTILNFIRENLLKFKKGTDLVIFCKPEITGLEPEEIRQYLDSAFKKLGVFDIIP